MSSTVNGITSQFGEAVGKNEGFVRPSYDVENTPIVVRSSENGVLVHEPVGLVGRLNGEGTGNYKSDAVKFYTADDFKKEIGTNFVTLKQYEKDFKGIEESFRSAPSSPVADDAFTMQLRIAEVARDLNAYEDKLKAQTLTSPAVGGAKP